MPEGDTVYRAARHLDAALRGKAIERFELRVPALATADLSGRTVDEVISVGKHLLHRIGDRTLRTHLGMDGAWHLLRAGGRWPRPAFQARAVLGVAGLDTIGFDLAEVELLRRDEEASAIGHLGPDLLGPDWDHGEAVRRLAADPDRELAAALLDQRSLAGLGNVYVNELCFLRGRSPAARIRDAGDLDALVTLARRLILANRDRVERTTTGDTRKGRRTYVYGREGKPCLRCGTRIERDRHGLGARTGATAAADGRPLLDDRVSYRCPRCQPGP